MRGGIVEVLANCVDEKTDGDGDTDCSEAKETNCVPLDGLSFRVGKDGRLFRARHLFSPSVVSHHGWGESLFAIPFLILSNLVSY